MGILSRVLFFEIAASAVLGSLLFIFVLFLQKASQLFSILVNSSATPETVGALFLLLLPATMPLTLPLGAAAGTLIALSRMSSDGEVTALRAAGVPARRLVRPVTLFSLTAMAVTAACSLYITPWANQQSINVINRMGAAQLTAEIQPRVFDESFPQKVLYVDDVLPGQPVRWRNVLLADLTPPEQRQSAATERGAGPSVTLASEAVVVPDPSHNRLQMSLLRSSTYEAGPDPQSYHKVSSPTREQVLEGRPRGEVRAKLYSATPSGELLRLESPPAEARIELHQRFALPLACLLLALCGVPLGVSSRKGGKSAAIVITVFFAFLYYMSLVSLIGLAREGRLAPEVAVWLPNTGFALMAVLLLARLERPGDADFIEWLRGWAMHHWGRLRGAISNGGAPRLPLLANGRRYFLLPQVIDTFVLSGFLFYFLTLLTSFVLLTEVFNFFELLGDTFRNNIPMSELLSYLLFLAPKLIYDAAPVSALVAVLVTFGVLAKNNEITAFKACGVSLHRLALPVFAAGLALSGVLFVFDYSLVTRANIVQDALRDKIKGRPAQTYLSPDRKWIHGTGKRIFYYRYFDPDQAILGGVSVYEYETEPMRLLRHVYAESARWEPRLNTWVFQNGWVRDVREGEDRYRNYQGETATFAEITETPAYFQKEVRTYKQMDYAQLRDYIRELRQSGFNTLPLQVQFHKKFAVPLFVFIMSMLAAPFAFLTGTRGAMTGVGISIGIAIMYFASNSLFEQLGNAGQLPPAMAAWSPNALFTIVGGYLLTRLRT